MHAGSHVKHLYFGDKTVQNRFASTSKFSHLSRGYNENLVNNQPWDFYNTSASFQIKFDRVGFS